MGGQQHSRPVPDGFRAAHNFRAAINVPGFHVTTWFDIFLTSVLAAFTEIQARVGQQKLWIGPNDHYFVYERQFWARDPYFEWFDHWLKAIDTPIVQEPAVFHSPRCWVADPGGYVPDDWRHAETWPPPATEARTLFLRSNATVFASRWTSPAPTFRAGPATPTVATRCWPPTAPKDIRVATNTVHHDHDHPSMVTLTVLTA